MSPRRNGDTSYRPLPGGHRKYDPPPDRQKLRFRIGLLIHRHPMQAAIALALLIVAIPLWLVIDNTVTLRNAVHVQRVQQAQIVDSRREVTAAFCKQINLNAAASNSQTDVLTGFIYQSVQNAKSLAPLYHKLGIPPEVLKRSVQANRRLARNLDQRKIPVLDCQRYLQTIKSHP